MRGPRARKSAWSIRSPLWEPVWLCHEQRGRSGMEAPFQRLRSTAAGAVWQGECESPRAHCIPRTSSGLEWQLARPAHMGRFAETEPLRELHRHQLRHSPGWPAAQRVRARLPAQRRGRCWRGKTTTSHHLAIRVGAAAWRRGRLALLCYGCPGCALALVVCAHASRPLRSYMCPLKCEALSYRYYRNSSHAPSLETHGKPPL